MVNHSVPRWLRRGISPHKDTKATDGSREAAKSAKDELENPGAMVEAK